MPFGPARMHRSSPVVLSGEGQSASDARSEVEARGLGLRCRDGADRSAGRVLRTRRSGEPGTPIAPDASASRVDVPRLFAQASPEPRGALLLVPRGLPGSVAASVPRPRPAPPRASEPSPSDAVPVPSLADRIPARGVGPPSVVLSTVAQPAQAPRACAATRGPGAGCANPPRP